MKDTSNWFQILLTMRELNVNIFGFAEIIQQMNRGGKYKWTDIIRWHYYYSLTVRSESKIITDTNYKPGGTISTITGKWQARVSKLGQDPRGFGRWSFIKISSKKKSIIIITAYRPCTSQGPSTSWVQQWFLLHEEGEANLDPIKSSYMDIEKQLLQRRERGHKIILMINVNELIGNPGGFTSIIAKVGLTDLIHHCQPHDEEINTYALGTKQIDYIFGTNGVQNHCH